MTLRLRLTVWYSAVLAWIIFLFGSAVYIILVGNLTRQIDTTLDEATREIIDAASLTSLPGVFRVDIPSLDRFGSSSIYVQIWRTDGTLFTRSDNVADLDVPFDARALTRTRESRRDVYVGEFHLRVLTAPITTMEGQVLAYVQAATPLAQVDTAKNTLLLVLIGGGVAAILLAGLIGWLAAHQALQPLEEITGIALQFTRADDLSRRIPIAGGPNDEVGRMVLAFNSLLDRLERLFNAQRRFLADISHELRTPLTAVRGNVDLLRRMGGADPVSLDAIQSEAERMSRMVGDLLLLAQSDAGNLPVARQPVELDTLLLEVFREAQILAGGVSVTIGEIDQAIVVGDRDRLKQLLLNLVSNALKFTPEVGRVILGLAKVGEWARLTVTDNGVGIPAEDLPHIFERFYRVDKARSRAQGGAGLGLSIAQRIASAHGGRIEAASEGIPGRGSTFSVWLPLAPEKPRKEREREKEKEKEKV